MNQTEHYQLNRWEKSDRIMMDDFNADNAKIDAALAAHSAALAANAAAMAAEENARRTADEALQSSIITTNPIVRLADVTTAQVASQVNLYIGNIDWAAYGEVLLFGRFKSLYTGGRFCVTLDGDTASSYVVASLGSDSGNITAGLCNLGASTTMSGFSARIPFTTYGFFSVWTGLMDGADKSGNVVTNVAGYCTQTSKLRTQYTNMNFTGSLPLDAGCRFVLLGVKL